MIASAAECREAPLAHEDEAALLVARRADGRLVQGCFCELGDFLRAGDLLVVNTSATLPAAVPATLDGRELTLHLSTPAGGERTGDAGPAGDEQAREAGPARGGQARDAGPAGDEQVRDAGPAGDEQVRDAGPARGGQARDAGPAGGGQARDAGPARGDRSTWVVELRTAERLPLRAPAPGAVLALPGGATAELLAPYLGSGRLSVARLVLGEPVEDYLRRHGRPIRYAHTADELPIEAYQTVFARDPGSAEMPSAARPFTAELVTELVARGVLLAPLTLHAGVSSLEAGESPYPERYRVPPETARLVDAVRAWGGRVIAVGTTVVRALETVAAPDGTVSAGAGQTSLVVTPERGLRAIDGLITGWHEPESSHLSLLEAAAGPELLRRSYAAAHAAGYRFHEFGDSHLILP